MKLGRKAPHGNDYPSAGDLAAQLARCRSTWLPAYFPHGRVRAGMFLIGDASGRPGDSLPVPLSAGKRRFKDFATGENLDDLSLLAEAIRGDSKAAFKEAIAFLGLGDGRTSAPRPAPAKAAAPPVQNDRNRERAQELWREAALRDWWPGSPAERYLHSRGITSWPRDILRFHPECPFGDVGEDGRRILRRSPAIIAPVHCHRTHLVVGVWRIRLTADGAKIGRAGLGPARGNCSRLYWPEGDEVALAEGVEDGLAFAQQHGVPTWAALSSTNMAALVLPDRLRRIVVCADNDAAGHAGAQRLAARMRREGREVRIIASDHGKDANDALRKAVS